MRLFLSLVLALGVVPAAEGQALPAGVDSGVALASRLAQTSGDRLWPGWSDAPSQLLIIGDSVESFVPAFGAAVKWTRPRVFPPAIQATFPAVDGVPTIVIGPPAASHQPVERWALTLLHEHLHQLQYSRPDYYPRLAALDLARGDSTGMWALNFPFPYDSAPVAAALQRWAAAMASALRASAAGGRLDLREVRASRAALDALLAPDDLRYLNFQLWQEGVPRWTELAIARDGVAHGLIGAGELQWQQDRVVGGLERLDPAGDRRVIVYALGAAVAELLTREGKPWRQTYFDRMFELDSP
ncbi:MAG TPA: hypothetical protein VFI13_06890 [Gemmatimonadales bacterium]|nr:hypothetical protein [Gemmatimonadales bacterium]